MRGSEGERSFPDFAVKGEPQAAAAILAQSDALLHQPRHRGCPQGGCVEGIRSELVSARHRPSFTGGFCKQEHHAGVLRGLRSGRMARATGKRAFVRAGKEPQGSAADAPPLQPVLSQVAVALRGLRRCR